MPNMALVRMGVSRAVLLASVSAGWETGNGSIADLAFTDDSRMNAESAAMAQGFSAFILDGNDSEKL
jgi:hypothetical protein